MNFSNTKQGESGRPISPMPSEKMLQPPPKEEQIILPTDAPNTDRAALLSDAQNRNESGHSPFHGTGKNRLHVCKGTRRKGQICKPLNLTNLAKNRRI